MRQLASVQTIASLEPIPNADAIVRAQVLGWWVVVKAAESAPGDKVVYCEVDSLLPERPEFEFLRKGCFRPGVDDGLGFTRPPGFRIRTVKLRGQVSQGICFPLSVLPPGTPNEVGTDVTAALGIVNYESPPPAGLTGKVKGGFPGFLTKTDETRVQVLAGVLERHRGCTFAVTEKLDGTSFTAFLRGDEYGICSRNLHLDERDEANALVRLSDSLELRDRLERMRATLGADVAIQGEVIGPGIQQNKYKLPAIELRVFTVINLTTDRWLDFDAGQRLLLQVGLTPVPVRPPLVLDHTVDQLVEYAAGPSVLNPGTPREGVVLRPLTQTADPEVGSRLSFKVINPAFLLKYDE